MASPAVITGGSGLLGRWTLDHWHETGLEVELVDHRTTDLLQPGAAEDLVLRTRPRVVVHLAWSASGSADYRMSEDNLRWVRATLELADACARIGSPLYATGTVVDDLADVDNDYARSKRRLRDALSSSIQDGSVRWLRPHYVFDPDRRRPSLISQAQGAAETATVLALDDPDAQHDFVHASDVGRAVTLAVAHDLRGVIEIGAGRTRRVREIVEVLGAAWVRSAQASAKPRTSTAPADIAALRSVGWAPSRTEEFFSHA